MDVPTALASVRAVQAAFLVLVALSLNTYKWPVHEDVTEGTIMDYIIVGGGTAGCVVANRLTEDPAISALVMEAGDDPPKESDIPSMFPYLTRTRLDMNYTTWDDGITAQYRTNKYLYLSAGKTLGGSSTIQHLYHLRSPKFDYADWVNATGDKGWSYDNLLPYFIKSEQLEDSYILNSATGKYHGTHGYIGLTRETRDLPLKYLDALREVGHKIVEDINVPEPMGFTRPMFNIKNGVRQSTAETYLSDLINRPNFHIMKNTLVIKILFNANYQAIGVQCIKSDGTIANIYARKEVIVAAGNYGTPKLLMLSGVGPAAHLNNLSIPVIADLPVGKVSQDHMGVILLHSLENTTEVTAPNPNQFPVPTFVGFGAVNKTQTNPDYLTLNLIARNSPAALMQLCSSVFALHNDVCAEMYASGVGREVLFTVLALGRPLSTGTVQLQSTNPYDPPKIYSGFLSNNADLEKYIDSIEDFIRITKSSYFKSVGGTTMYLNSTNCDVTLSTRDYWTCYIYRMMDTIFHYSSSCPMGTVLDSHLRVYNVTKLRVVDASAMPNVVSGNIHAAVLALAEKAADLIKQDNSCSNA